MFSLCLIETLVVVDVIGTKPGVTAEQAIKERAIGFEELGLKKRKVKLHSVVCHQTDWWVEAGQKGGEAGDQVGIKLSLLFQFEGVPLRQRWSEEEISGDLKTSLQGKVQNLPNVTICFIFLHLPPSFIHISLGMPQAKI